MKRRTVYRSTYISLTDDPDFLRLSPGAKLLFWTLKHHPQGNVAGIFMVYPDMLAYLTGHSRRQIGQYLGELRRGNWVDFPLTFPSDIRSTFRGGFPLWIRNSLRYDPCGLSSPNIRTFVLSVLDQLPQCEVTQRFRNYYNLEKPETLPPNPSLSGKGTLPPTLPPKRHQKGAPNLPDQIDQGEQGDLDLAPLDRSDIVRAPLSLVADEPRPVRAPRVTEEERRSVVAHYLATMPNRRSYELTPKRRRVLDLAIDYVGPEGCKQAIDVFARSPAFAFQRGEIEAGKRFDGLCEYVIGFRCQPSSVKERIEEVLNQGGIAIGPENDSTATDNERARAVGHAAGDRNGEPLPRAHPPADRARSRR